MAAKRRNKRVRLILLFKQQKGRCYYCAVKMSFDVAPDASTRATTDHRTPLARGGTNRIDNIVAACFRCNHRKGQQTEEEFLGNISEADLKIIAARAESIPPQFEHARDAAARAIVIGQREGKLTQADHDMWNKIMGITE